MAPTKKVVLSEELSDEIPVETPVVEEEAVAVAEEETPEVEEDEENPYDNPTSLEDLDPEDELWPSGPKIGQIIAWKEEFGDVYVTSLTVDKHVVWRTMSRPEYRKLIRDMEEAATTRNLSSAAVQLFQEEYITDLCTLFHNGTKASEDLAGMATIIAQEVMDQSGFVPLEMRQL